MAESWTFDPQTREYRSADGQRLTLVQLIAIRDGLANGFEEVAALIVRQYLIGQITADQFYAQFSAFLWDAFLAQFLLGRGGTNMVAEVDLLVVDHLVFEQRFYLSRFTRELTTGLISQPMAEARGKLYAGASVQAFDAGRELLYPGLRLPYYPAQNTICGSRCRCWWSVEEYPDRYEAYWHTEEDKSVCDTCLHREVESAPYVQQKPTITEGPLPSRYNQDANTIYRPAWGSHENRRAGG